MLCSRGAGALVVAGAALAVSWLIFERAIRAGGPLEWDEAYHSLWGLLIADDLLRFRLVSFAFDSYRQVYWPPLHSWYLAALFMTFSPSIPLARASSLLALVGIAVVVYLTARLLVVGERSRTASGPGDRSCAATVGGIASAVSLLRAGGVQVLAPQAMLELPALFWLAVGFWLYVRCTLADPESGGRTYVLLGFATLATYLTRTSYGVLLALALAVAFLFDGRWLDRRPRTVAKQDDPRAAASAARRRGQTLAALAFGVPLALWLAYPAKIATTLSALSNVPVGPERFSLDGLLYYPRATLWLAGSWPLLVVWLLGLVLTLRPRLLRSDSRLRFVVIFLGLQFLLAELAVTKLERHILPLVLGFSLLGGFWAGRLWTRLEALRRTSPAWSAPALVTGLAAVGAAALLLWQAGTLGGPATMTASPPRSALPARVRSRAGRSLAGHLRRLHGLPWPAVWSTRAGARPVELSGAGRGTACPPPDRSTAGRQSRGLDAQLPARRGAAGRAWLRADRLAAPDRRWRECRRIRALVRRNAVALIPRMGPVQRYPGSRRRSHAAKRQRV